jgi:hypothetical protein
LKRGERKSIAPSLSCGRQGGNWKANAAKVSSIASSEGDAAGDRHPCGLFFGEPTTVPSTIVNRAAQYRQQAQTAREKAGSAPDEAARQRLLRDAALWERMADYDEKHPTRDFDPPYS